jgi:hypothetical protein
MDDIQGRSKASKLGHMLLSYDRRLSSTGFDEEILSCPGVKVGDDDKLAKRE